MMPMIASQVLPRGVSSISSNTFSSRATCSSVSVSCFSNAALSSSDRAALAILGRALECAPDGGQFAGWELTGATGLSRMKAMAKHRIHSIEFKRQIAQDFIAGESLHV